MFRSKTFTILLHAVGWILLFGLILGFATSRHGTFDLRNVLHPTFLLFMALYLFIFYFNAYFLVPQLYLRQDYWFYFLSIGLMLVGVAFLQPFERLVFMGPGGMEGHPPPPFGPRPRFGRPFGRPRIDIVSIILFLMVWAWSTAMQVTRQWRATERRALKAETDKAHAELSFLKAQINPHFLFNTLNNIYSLSVTKNDHTPDAILKLSNILRYVTDEAANDFVPLSHEVACIRDYIDLQRLRLGDKASVDFNVQGTLEGKEVPPLIFITFVENVFKYGISSHAPSPITIEVTAGDDTISFHSRNRIFEAQRPAGRSGIGIKNTEQRLEYLYPYRHMLSIATEEGWYAVKLTLEEK